jgi:site-specific DNA-cytosine methylase
MRVACLFDGCGLARLGLEMAGHDVVGFELNPKMHLMGQYVGGGNTILADATKVDLRGFDAVWASPPCQLKSSARTQGAPVSPYAQDYLQWCLNLPAPILWVESVREQTAENNKWGKIWNAAQFLEKPIQNRNRVIGGRYPDPKVFRPFQKWYGEFDICPTISATEWKGCASDTRRASRWYGRRLEPEECVYHQGFEIPSIWYDLKRQGKIFKRDIYEAIGNGVPVYMSKAFGICC